MPHLRESLMLSHYGVPLQIESDCAELLARLRTSGIWSDPCEISPPAACALPLGVARFHDAEVWSLSFDRAACALTIAGPINRFLGLSLGYLRMLSEYVRQRAGVVSLHASCVEFGGGALVFYGPAHAGKTTVALELCRRLGARFVANDRVLVAMNDVPLVVGGDETVNLRLSSLRLQDEALVDVIRGDAIDPPGPAVRIERAAAADRLAFTLSDAAELPLRACLQIRLDGARTEADVRCFRADDDASDLLDELQSLLLEVSRFTSGAGVLPVDDDLDVAVDAPVLNLDDAELVRQRRAFLRRLGRLGLVGRAFGSLPSVVQALERM